MYGDDKYGTIRSNSSDTHFPKTFQNDASLNNPVFVGEEMDSYKHVKNDSTYINGDANIDSKNCAGDPLKMTSL